MKTHSLFILLALTFPISSHAADNKGNYAIWGSGNKSCYSYTQARKTDNFDSFKHYLMGFLTAYNVLTPDTFRLSGQMNLNEILAWFDNYCELKAIHAFDLAIVDFIEERYETRIKSASSFGRGSR